MTEGIQRRLAAILAADVVGYSRLMGEDESNTLAALRQWRTELFEPAIGSNNGNVVKNMGDGWLVEFDSAGDAVTCAIQVQEKLSGHKILKLRIGLHIGDITHADNDIYGDGVNIAARLQEIAEPGAIVISDMTRRSIDGKLAADFSDLGQLALKNIADPVTAYGWNMTALGNAQIALALPGKPSIAVLPFDNMSGDPEQGYFSDGLAEDIITALSRWRSFPVIARNSTFVYKDKRVDVKQAAQELGARYVLEGSVRKGGGRVRITAQLIDGVSGHQIWAERYDRKLADVFEVQDEIVQRITATVAPELLKAEVKRSKAKRPEDLDAWDYYQRGMALLRERTLEANAKAHELFGNAIAVQDDYSDAYAGLAMAHNSDILLHGAEDRMKTATQAMAAARKAVEYDDASSQAHHGLSTAYQWLNRHEDALAEVKIAVDLNPNNAEGLHALGNKSDLAGDPHGIACMEKAQKLNPADTLLHTHLTFLARAYYNASAYDEAADRARQAIRRRPEYAPAYYILAIALAQLDHKDEAQPVLSKCEELMPGLVESRKNWQPYADPASNEKLREGLRRAGMPED